jgi:hypothetical protein
MHDETSPIAGAVTGGAIAAVAAFIKNDDDTQQRLRSTQQDVRSAAQSIQAFKSRGEMLRARLPVVQDFQSGLAAASSALPTASVIPSTVQQVRPNLAASMESAVSAAQWPLVGGQYDEYGMVQQVGEMGILAESLTLQETRALIQAAAQGTAPSPAALGQIWRGINALVYQLAQQGLTWQQYQQIWAALFGMASGANLDPHQDPNRKPTAATVSAAAIVEFSGPAAQSRNTDAAMRWRIGAGTSGHGPGDVLARVTFGTPYRCQSAAGPAPFAPNVLTNRSRLIYATNISDAGFDLVADSAIGANTSVDLYVSTVPGLVAV